ncbi:MAG TPA: TetR/AcrR family transcriptional regulator [Polyangiaceae bacterium]|nr:TetR/AcrR family transcriptional regulator [Polyangiaceae bacterium]
MARPRSDIHLRIVRAARARFLAEGVDGASLRNIATDAGTNVGMVFYYFPTKDDLLLAVVEEVYASLLTDLGGILSVAGSTRDRLKRVFVRLGKASEDELAVVRLVVREALLSSDRFDRIFARMQRGHVGMLLDELSRGARQGEIDPRIAAPLLLLSTLGLGGLPQLVRRAAGDRPPFASLPGPEALAEMSVELLFRAIGPRPSRRTGGQRSRGAKPVK